jgi:hypothetical protein
MGRARVAVVAAVTTAAVVATLLVFGNGGDERGWAGRLTGERVQKDRRQAPVPVPIAPRKPRYPVPRGVIRDLLHARSLARTRLANAAFAEDQAAAARSLQVYYRQAARRIQLSALPGDRGDALVAALRDTNAAYARLAASILAGDQIAFDEARGAIEAGEAAVWRAVWRAVPEATGQLSGGSS